MFISLYHNKKVETFFLLIYLHQARNDDIQDTDDKEGDDDSNGDAAS